MTGPAPEGHQPSFLFIILRHWLLVGLCCAVAIAAVFAGSWLRPAQYAANASLIVKLGREFTFQPVGSDEQAAPIFQLDEMINSELEILESRRLISEVVTGLGISRVYPDLAAEAEPATLTDLATATFRGNLTVQAVPESSVIQISFDHLDPALAAECVNTLVERFIDRHLEIFSHTETGFLEQQVAFRRTDMDAASGAQTTYMTQHGIVDSERQRESLLEQRSEIEAEKQNTWLRITELRNLMPSQLAAPQFDTGGLLDDDLETVRRHMAGLREVHLGSAQRTSVGPAYGSTEEANKLLLELRMQRAQAASGSSVARQIEALDEQIRLMERFLTEGVLDELESVWSRDVILLHRQAGVDAELRRLSEADRELRELQRTLEAAELQYTDAYARWQEARMADELDAEGLVSVRVLDRAAVPFEPNGLSLKTRLVLGGMAGLAAGVLLAMSLGAVRP